MGPDIYQIVMANLLAELTTDGQQMAPFQQPSVFHFLYIKIVFVFVALLFFELF